MPTTALALINSSARKIGVRGTGKDLSADELTDWLTGLKQMLDGWADETALIPWGSKETFSLTAAQSYTMGTGGDFNTLRPIRITDMRIVDATGEYYPVYEAAQETWARARAPLSQGRPRLFYRQEDYPLDTLHFDKAPFDPSVTIWSLKPLQVWDDAASQKISPSTFDVTTWLNSITLEPGYELAIIFNLGILMAPEYDVDPSLTVAGLADHYKSRIERTNLAKRMATLTHEKGMGHSRCYGHYDIVNGPGGPY